VPPKITPVPDGPLIVDDLEHFENSRGEAIATKKKVALCRCGASRNKPFCDGSHTGIGFDGAKHPARIPDQLDTYEGEALTILDNRGICSHAG